MKLEGGFVRKKGLSRWGDKRQRGYLFKIADVHIGNYQRINQKHPNQKAKQSTLYQKHKLKESIPMWSPVKAWCAISPFPLTWFSLFSSKQVFAELRHS